MITETITIARRFNGPPGSGNGGYVSGRLANYLNGPASVRLRIPPPLDTELRVEASDNNARMFHGDTLVAEAVRSELQLVPPAAPTFSQAQRASDSLLPTRAHPVPTCFVCGPQRREGDGMHIFAAPLEQGQTVAAPWVPDASLADESGRVSPEFLWGALDCPGGFAVMPPEGKLILLGEMCARIDGSVAPGEQCVVIGWPIGVDGRKRHAGTAVYSGAGRLVALAKATWIEVPLDMIKV